MRYVGDGSCAERQYGHLAKLGRATCGLTKDGLLNMNPTREAKAERFHTLTGRHRHRDRHGFRSPKFRFHCLTLSTRPSTRSRSRFPQRKQKRSRLKLRHARRGSGSCFPNIDRARAMVNSTQARRSQSRSRKSLPTFAPLLATAGS